MASAFLKQNLTQAVRDLTGMEPGGARKVRADALHRELQVVDSRWLDQEVTPTRYWFPWAVLNAQVQKVRTAELHRAGVASESRETLDRARETEDLVTPHVPAALGDAASDLKKKLDEAVPVLGAFGLVALVLVVATVVLVARVT